MINRHMSSASEMVPCRHCGAPSPRIFSTQDYNRRLSDEVFDFHRCPGCSFIFMAQFPHDLGRYYPMQYYDVPKSMADLAQRAERLQRWKIDLVLRHVKGGRLLEIGPAYGLFAYLAKRAGFDVTVIEMDSRCSAFLRETVGVQVVESPDTVRSLMQLKPFDAIVMWQVIEHLPDPWAVLTAAADRLAPNGTLILDTPNPDAFQFRVLGKYWTHVDAPRHVCLIPAPTLVSHVAGHDLKPVSLSAADVSANGFNGFGWAFSFRNFFTSEMAGSVAHFLGRVLAKMLIPIERTGWRGSTYTAVFRKESGA
jgi:SAM-dependent methyltransferase